MLNLMKRRDLCKVIVQPRREIRGISENSSDGDYHDLDCYSSEYSSVGFDDLIPFLLVIDLSKSFFSNHCNCFLFIFFKKYWFGYVSFELISRFDYDISD
jgi:hypothetical protein